MNSEVIHNQKQPIEAGSAYLNKPLRTLEQVLAAREERTKADIETQRAALARVIKNAKREG